MSKKKGKTPIQPVSGTKVPSLYIANITIVNNTLFLRSFDCCVELIFKYYFLIWINPPNFSNKKRAPLATI